MKLFQLNILDSDIYIMTNQIYDEFKKFIDNKQFTSAKTHIEQNPETFNDFDIRRKAKRYMNKKASDEVINDLLPSRLNLRGNRNLEAVENIMKGADVDAELRYIQSISKTATASNVAVSAIKKELKLRGYTSGVEDISRSEVKDEIVFDTIEERAEATAENGEKLFYIDPYFMAEHVIKRLLDYVENTDTLQITNAVIADVMINFSARPSELYNLELIDGFISGQSKDRGNNTYTKYVGVLPFDQSKLLLDKIKQHPEASPAGVRQAGIFARFMRTYKMTPSQLRKIGAHYASMGERNKIKRLRKKQEALRHKSLGTSILHYDISDRITHD